MKLWAILGILVVLSGMGGTIYYLIDSRAHALAEAAQAKADADQLRADSVALADAREALKANETTIKNLKRLSHNVADTTGCYRTVAIPDPVVTGMREFQAKVSNP